MIQIDSRFDAGAIEVDEIRPDGELRLRLRADNAAGFRQWFYFRVQSAAGQALRMVFGNAADAAYPDGWPGYRCVASYDRREWFRISTTRYEDGRLIVEHTPQHDSIWYAYFEPYPHERHLDLIAQAQMSPYAEVRTLGRSVEGRSIDLLQIGQDAPGRLPVWIIARQHPGETMGPWCVEGLLDGLLDPANPLGRRIREHAVLRIVPNMNPDGAIRGNLRTNAAGRNLNREWREPDPQFSPEVACVRAAIEASGCALFLDLHGDEALPYVFFSKADEVPGFAAVDAQARFIQTLKLASPDFQDQHGYQSGRFGEELLTLASKWVAWRFGCLSLTLEMPFKDNANLPDGRVGWNGARSRELGRALLVPICDFVISQAGAPGDHSNSRRMPSSPT